VFFVEGELPAEVLERGVAGLDLETKLELLDRAVARAEGWVQGMLEISRTLLVAERDGGDAALAELASVRERHPHHGFVLSCAGEVAAAIERGAAAAVR
jgi:hypothetical protein